MAKPITVSIAHQLGRAEARRRVETGFEKLVGQLPGGARTSSTHWEDDRLVFHIAVVGQAVPGVVNVLDTAVTIEIELPGVLGVIASGLTDQLQKAGQRLLIKQ